MLGEEKTRVAAKLFIGLVGCLAWGIFENAGSHRAWAQTQDPAAAVSPPSQVPVDPALSDGLLSEIHDLTPGGIRGAGELETGCQAAVRAFIDGDANGALEQFDRLRQKHPQLPPAALLLAGLFYSVGNAQQGSRWLEDAANANPDLPTIYNAFARLAIAQGRKTDARVLLEKSQSVLSGGTWSPTETEFFTKMYHDCMADLMLLRSDYADARRYLELLLQADPAMGKAVMRLAQVDFRQKKFSEALQRLEEFRKLAPESRVPELMLASMHAEDGQESEAANWVQKAFERYPEDNNVVLEYVDWMVAHEDFAAALGAIQKNESRVGMLPAVLMFRGKIAFAQMQYSQAEEYFSRVRASEPTNVEVSTMLAISMAEQNDADKLNKALEIAKQNVQLQPQNPVTASVLGWVLFKQNNLAGAGEWLNRAAQGGRLPPESAYYIAKFLMQQGAREQALEFTNNALKTSGLFLYRQPAEALQKELNNSAPGSSGTLNPPKK